MSRNNTFKMIGGLNPGRSVFDLSYEKKLTCDMGQLIPIMCDEVVPGDILNIANKLVIRMQPLVAPVLHEVNAFIHVFFVPYRLLWDEWEDFITGGVNGDFAAPLPRWDPINTAIGSLWDYLGLPTGVDPNGAYPIDFIRSAYNFIFNEYYRDQNFQVEVALTNENILNRAFEKDYFTAALPWQQRGVAPALPISGIVSAEWTLAGLIGSSGTMNAISASSTNAGHNRLVGINATQNNNILGAFNNNTVDLSGATTFNVSDLRLAFQIQKWLERNARAGARYTEFLRAHFAVSPRDDRLDRPEYIGGCRSPIIISEVLQTSSTDATSPQGNLAGHGITADVNRIGKYRVQEYGLVMGLLSVMPRTAYQQGINRQWLRRTKYDFYFPEFANLSEQAIEQAEIYATGVEAENRDIFGYQGRYDEMRYKPNQVCGLMRTDFKHWHLGRIFASSPDLNASFIQCDTQTGGALNPFKRIFAVPSKPGLIVSCANIIKAIRPMPVQSNPGLIDHM